MIHQQPGDRGPNPDGPPSDDATLLATGSWKAIAAVGVLADDLSPSAVARYARVAPTEALEALDAAERAGLIVDGAIPIDAARELLAELTPESIARIHASIARSLMSEGLSRLDDVIFHARQARAQMPLRELIEFADHAGRMCLAIGDYSSARKLLELAEELGVADPSDWRAQRACDLSIALDGLGHSAAAREAAGRAFELASFAGNPTIAVRAALAYSFPVDWYAGDTRAGALLHRAEQLGPTADELIALRAARATVEMRVPVAGSMDQQLAWITRPQVSQPLSDAALAASVSASPETRLVALLSWRFTHMAPAFLDQRLATSTEALNLAQILRIVPRQVEAALLLATDHLESGNRAGFDEALGVARWVADRDGNPRLRWRAYSMAAGAAHLDGDLDNAVRYRRLAHEIGTAVNVAGCTSGDLLLRAEEALARPLPAQLERLLLPEDFPALRNGIARAFQARVLVLLGRADEADHHLRKAIRELDDESSLLFLAALVAEVTARAGIPDIAEQLLDVLRPWADRVAVDTNAWWVTGPVSLALAELDSMLGRTAAARPWLRHAELLSRAIGDVRSIQRATDLRRLLGPDPEPAVAPERQAPVAVPVATAPVLTRRESEVLVLVARGLTNAAIAAELAHSPSTVRNTTVTLYRKLGATNRAEATSIAHQLGLV